MKQPEDHGGQTLYALVRKDNESQKSEAGWQPLRIEDKEIRMFQEPILRTFSGKMRVMGQGNASGNSKLWKLTFFGGTPYEEKLFVSFSENEPERPRDVLGRGIWQTVNKNEQPSGTQLKTASRWLRDSETLSLDSYGNRSQRWSCADGNGVSLFSLAWEQSTFERSILLVALALAYRMQLEKLMNELATCNRNAKTLSVLAQKASEFNARCYFRHPVDLSNTEAPLMWRDISERMQLDNLDQEMMEQVRTLHDITSSLAQFREHRRWQWVGLGLALISAAQIISIFPDEVRDRWMFQFLSLFGA